MSAKRWMMALWVIALAVGCTGEPEGEMASETPYVVVVSNATFADAGWRKAAETLSAKYDAEILFWNQSPEELRLELAARMPRYTCFVARPEEAGRDFTLTVSRLARTLDDDPWTDTLWGILTGYESSDALRIAQTAEPLQITRVLDATGQFNLESFETAVGYDEFHRGELTLKLPGQKLQKLVCDTDNTDGVIDALEQKRVQFMATSAHATQHDWHMGYKGPNMVMRHKDGELLAINTKKESHALTCPEPKVYIASGNCLIGDIPGKDCMATSWIHSGGTNQFVGYTVVTWFGFMGWGTLQLFTENPGQYNLTEAFHFNNIRTVWRLQEEFPKHASKNLNAFNMKDLAPFARWELGIAKDPFKNELLGLLFDRDVVAFYGDPAWDARIREVNNPAFTVHFAPSIDGAGGQVILRTERKGEWPSTGVFVRLPKRIANWKISRNTTGCRPVIADDFVYLPLKGAYAADDELRLGFTAEPANLKVGRAMNNDARELIAFLTTHNTDGEATDIPALQRALSNARGNLTEIMKGFRACQDDLAKTAFLWSLIDATPDDLQNVEASFLAENATYAVRAWKRAPWRQQVSPRLFRDYILPFSCLDEARDPWRQMLYEKFAEKAFTMKSASEAALWLDKHAFEAVGVTYHATKRPKPNQSVAESVAAKYASCTGLSVILAEACRAVGIPARVVGVPVWTDLSGNHNWVEYWDDQWIYQGASPSDPRGNDWVRDKVNKFTQGDKWEHSVIAAVRRPQQGRYFLLAWSPLDNRTPAINVTPFYTDSHMQMIELPGDGAEKWVFYRGEPLYRLTGKGTKQLLLPKSKDDSYTFRTESLPPL